MSLATGLLAVVALIGRLVMLFENTAVNEDWSYWLVEPENKEGRAEALISPGNTGGVLN